MKREPSKSLTDLERAITRGDLRAAFTIAVTAWRSGRRPELADVACAIGTRLERHPGLQGARGGRAFQRAWIELAATREPLALGALLPALTRSCPVVFVSSRVNWVQRRFAAWRARVEALATFDDDPRMTDALVELVRSTPFATGRPETGEALYEPAIVLLERLRDVRSLPALRALVERPVTKTVNLRDYLARRLPVAIETIASSKIAPLDAALVARLDAIAEALGASASPEPKAMSAAAAADLFEAVVSATSAGAEDLGPWEVLADHWLECGSPRGELVSLMLAWEREPSNDGVRARLSKIKDKDWLDPVLVRLTKNRRRRRGMLDSFELLPTSAAAAAVWEDAARSPDLRTVRQVGQGAASAAVLASLLTTGAMRSLSDISLRTRGVIDQLRADDPLARRLAHLTLERIPRDDDWLAPITRDRFPSLDRLRIVPGDEAVDVDDLLQRLARWPRRPALVEVTLGRLVPAFLLGHRRLPDVPALAIAWNGIGGDGKLDGFWADTPDRERLVVRRTAVGGRPRLELEARIEGDSAESWEAIEAASREERFDLVTFELGGEEDRVPADLVRRVLAALGQPVSALPEAWRARLETKRAR